MLVWGAVIPADAAHVLRIFADLDNNPSTGCTILTVNGPWTGAELVVTNTIDAGQVTSVVEQACTGSGLGPPVPSSLFPPPWPVGLGNGTGGSDVVETYIMPNKLGGGTIRLGFALDDGFGVASTLLTRNGLPGGPPLSVILGPVPIPTLGTWAFVLLVLLVLITGVVFVRRRGLRAGAWGVLLVVVAGVAVVWAAIVLDGQIGDWAGVPPSGTDESGTSAIKATFAVREGTTIFVRADGGFVCAPMTVNPTTVADGIRNIAYAPVTFTQTGGTPPITWSHTGALPAGMSLSAGGELSGTPTEAGVFPIVVRATDARGCVKQQAVSLTVNINAPPTANAQGVGTNEETPLPITLSGSDTDSPGGLTFAIVTGPSHGSLSPLGAPSCGPSGGGSSCTASVTYTPNGNYEGPDSFTFTVNDGIATSAEATVSITVAGVNDPPVVNGATFSLPENSPNGTLVGAPITFADPDAGQTWSFSIVGGNTGGAFAIGASSGQITVANVGAVDFETNPTFSLTVRVTDTGVPALSGDATVTINLTDVNDAPVVTPATFSLPENSANGTVVGTVAATDQDPGQTKTFAITAGNTGGAFAIDPSTGQITVLNSTALDFETNPTFSLTVQVTDNGAPAQAGTATVTVNLTNASEAPVVNAATFGLPENSPNGTVVGTVSFADSDTGQTHAFSITAGNTGGAFAIDGSSGQITVATTAALNFETTPTFSLTVRVDDNGTPALFGTATITVNLTDVNEAPVVDAATFGIAENSPNGTNVGSPVTFTDPDTGQTHTFAITAGNTGTAFAINPTTGQITVNDSTALNFETTPTFSLTVEVTDNGAPPLAGAATITVNLSNVNDVPVAQSQTESTPEDTGKQITLTATDQDHLALTFSIVGTPAHGGLSAVTLDPCTPNGTGGATCTAKVTYTPTGDFNGTDSFTFKVNDTVVDSNTATITVTVNASPDAPVANSQTPSTLEDTPLLITLSGVDVDGHNLTFALESGPTNGSLNLPFSPPSCQPPDSNGAVTCTSTVTYTPNSQFNGPDSFTFTVNNTVTDSAVGTVSITVTAQNDPPVAQDVTGGTTPEETPKTITLTATDIDSLSLTFVVDDPPHGSVSAVTPIGCIPDGSGGTTCTATVDYTPDLNFTGDDSFTYHANDGTSDSNTATVSITVTATNDAPVAQSQSVETQVSTAKVITLSGTDVDSPSLTFSLGAVSPAHGGLGPLGAPTCVPVGGGTSCTADVTYTPTAGYVGPDSFTFKVNDGSVDSPEGTVSITVINTPPAVDPATFSVPENSANGTVVGTVTFTDPDAGQTHTFAITAGNTGNAFAINASSGQITVATTAALNFESTPTFSLTVQVTDSGTPAESGTATITVNLTDVNEAPTVNAATFSVPENSASGTVVGTVTATEPDAGQTLTFSITGGNTGNAFAINASSGQITVATTAALNFEVTPTFSLTVQAQDNGSPQLTGGNTITINLTDVNEPPVVNAATFAVNENSANGTVVGTVTFTDPDAGQTHTFSITGGNTGTAFAINASSGQITVATTAALNFEVTPSFSLTVQVTDNGVPVLSGSNTITINLTNVNDAPVAQDKNYSAQANMQINIPAASGLLVGATDEDATPAQVLSVGTVSATSPAGGNVIVNAADGSFSFNPPPGATGNVTFTYQVCDDGAGFGGAGAAQCSANKTVTFAVATPVIWFVDSNGSAGDGRLGSPFNTLAAANAVDAANHHIFLYSGTYTTGISLNSGESLIGQGVSTASDASFTDFDAVFGITPPTGTVVRPGIAGTRPTVQGTVFLGTGAGAVANSKVRGLNLSTGTSNGLAGHDAALAVTGAVVTELNVTTTTGTAVILNNVGGTITIGSVTSTGGTAVSITGGSGSVDVTGTVSRTGAAAAGISVASRTSGTVTFSGGTKTLNTGTSPAVSLTGTGAGTTITFSGGGLDIDTTTGAGFTATGSGTVNVTGAGNSVTTTSGTSVNITTTIGTGVTFQSVAHNGNNTAIILSNTGSGPFTVTGTGSTDGSGGTIQNIVGSDAISLNNTGGLVTLNNMIIQDISASTDSTDAQNTRSGVDGIQGLDVNGGLSLDNTTIRRISDNAIYGAVFGGTDGNTVWNGLTIANSTIEDTNRFHVASKGDANNEGSVRILGIRGTVNITNSLFQRGAEFLDFFVTAGTLNMTVTGSQFLNAYKEFVATDNSSLASVGNHGVDVTVQGSANANVVIGDRNTAALGNTFLNGRLASLRVGNDAGATGTVNVTIGRNTFQSNDHSSGVFCNPGCQSADFDFPMAGVLLFTLGTTTSVFNAIVDNNVFDEVTNASGGVGQLTLAITRAVWQALITNNTFDTPGNAPWFLRADGNPTTAKVKFLNNTGIRGFFSCPDAACDSDPGPAHSGGYFGPGLRALADVQNGGSLDLTIDGDDFAEHDAGFDPGQTFEARVGTAGGATTACVNLKNNTAPDGYSLEQLVAGHTLNVFTTGGSGTCTAPGSPGNCQNALNANNNTGGSNNANTTPPFVNVVGTVNVVATACQEPGL